MRTRLLLAAIFLWLAACSGGEPDLGKAPKAEVVDRIERLLPENECIGALARWERHYYFPMRMRKGGERAPDEDTVMFNLAEAGVYEFKSGRHIEPISDDVTFDHRQYRMASGVYHIPTARLTIRSCGWNCGANVPPGGSCG